MQITRLIRKFTLLCVKTSFRFREKQTLFNKQCLLGAIRPAWTSSVWRVIACDEFKTFNFNANFNLIKLAFVRFLLLIFEIENSPCLSLGL